MATLREVIVFIVRHRPGITDRQLTEAIYGSDERHQQVNAECRTSPEIDRRQGAGNIGNFVRDTKPLTPTLTLVHCGSLSAPPE